VLEKRKKFHAYSGTNGSLFGLWLRLLHVMLDVILIVCVTSCVCNKVTLHHKHHPKFTLKFLPLNLQMEALKFTKCRLYLNSCKTEFKYFGNVK
jgi:hypothetical protein